MTNTVNQQPTAVSLQLTDYLLLWQSAQSPQTRKLAVSGLASHYASLTGATFTGHVTVSAGGISVTGNSTITGVLSGLTGLTVASGGASITGNTTITGNVNLTGTLSGLTGLTVASGGLVVTLGGATITGGLTSTNALTVSSGGLFVSAGGAAITGNSTVTGTLGVSGAITGASIGTSGNGVIGGTLGVTGVATVGGLTVFGGGGATISGLLTTINDVSVQGFISVTGFNAASEVGWQYDNAGGTAFGPGVVSFSIDASTNNVLAQNFFAISDVRFKLDIDAIDTETAVGWLKASRPVTYVKNGVRETGFIAQEQVRAGYGHLVATAPHDGLPELVEGDFTSKANLALTLNYSNYIAYLTAALQDAFRRIEALEAEVD